MNKLVWIGVAAVAAVLLFMVWMYSTFIDSRVAPPDRFKQIDNTTTSRTQTPQPPPTTAVVKPPFNAFAYEVNYTLVFTISFSGVTITTEGWFVVGVGPSGNYSFGTFTSLPLRDVATYKSATEGDTAYIMTCLHGHCTVDRGKWSFTLIEGVNATRTAVGQCRHLSYAGTLYEERGMLKPKTSSHLVEDVLGNYTAYICEVNGVMLSANLTATALARSEAARITMKIEAVKAGPYRPDTYRLILKEIKTHK
jgi:hypothetical protein